ncbi:MAG: hypothetical protein IPN34_23990 [Planctomycetes bacterium]|nr:hypothetical protein [Planctomycetota bacterium]
MALPDELKDSKKYGLVWEGELDVTPSSKNSARASVGKQFHAYVEIYEQSAHDAALAKLLSGGTRSPHRAQVKSKNTEANPLDYYESLGEMAAKVVASEMHSKWENNKTNNTVFVRGKATTLTVQGKKQDDGYHYEITMWYDVGDIYLAFHCYHP